ncbi:MAG: adenylate/guanylate cyclase domain-containing protein [Variovorax sp.]|nr:MAG: adenylate/guanylate cyclase domain-containing protein [Variovorax sp.]
MECARCHQENRAEARFCQECGIALAVDCSACGSLLPAAAKFCSVCGALATIDPLATARSFTAPKPAAQALEVAPTPPAISGDRRQAAILFADISGYTALCARNDPERVQAMLGRFFDEIDKVVEAYGGCVIDRVGDAVMVVFGAPKAHGNDAQRAVRAALDMHTGAAALSDCEGQPLCLHIGVANGEVVANTIIGGASSKYSVTGAAVNLAARLDAMASSGETLISDSMYRSLSSVLDVQAMGQCAVKGFAAPVPVWKLLGIRVAQTERSAFVGRHVELAQVLHTLDTVRDTQSGLTIFVSGDAGIGKSRLVEELRIQAKLQGFDIPMVQVLDFGVGQGRDAVPTILRAVIGVPASDDEGDRRRAVQHAIDRGLIVEDEELFVNELLDLHQPLPLKAIFDAMDNATRQRRSCETLAAVLRRTAALRPLLVTIEDIHWASAELPSYIASLAEASTRGPIILVVTSRIRAESLHPSWRCWIGGSPALTIDLAPLTPPESQLLAGPVVEESNRFALRCIERAEGNPLFLEQLLRMSNEGDELTVPPTIQSLILEKMDWLARDDRVALQTASVLGKLFSLDNLRAIAGEPEYSCDSLIAADMIRADGKDYLFAHALIQEAVYSSTLKSTRRELHRRCAQLFAEDEPVLRAEHLDKAESPDAAEAYLGAARKEADRFRPNAALRLADRGAELALTQSLGCALALMQGEMLRETGQSKKSIVAFQSALDLAELDEQRCQAWMGIAAGHRVTGELPLAMDALSHAQPIAEQLGLTAECSGIHHTRGNLHFAQGDVSACGSEHQQALDLALQSQDAKCEVNALGGMADANYAEGRMLTALSYFRRCVSICAEHAWVGLETSNRCMVAVCLWYQSALDEGIRELQRACVDAQRIGMVPVQIFALDTLAILLSEAGRFDETEGACVRGLSLARPAASRRYESLLLWNMSAVCLRRGHLDEARAHLGVALDLARQTGLGSLGPAIYARLARAASSPSERTQALLDGEALLKEPCLAHAHLGFYRDAIEATIEAGDWEETLRYANALEEFVRAQPLPWAQLVAARARCLSDVAVDACGQEALNRLRQLREEVVATGWGSALAAIDTRLSMLQVRES